MNAKPNDPAHDRRQSNHRRSDQSFIAALRLSEVIARHFPGGESKTPKLSKDLLLAASIIYLCVEIVFNMSLLEAVSSLDAEALHHVEEFGRIASAFGFTLLVLSPFASSGFQVRGWTRSVLFGLVLMVCAFPFIATPYQQWTLLLVGLGASIVTVAALGGKGRQVTSSVLSLVGIVIIAWPAFYQGKPAILEHYIVGPSSGEDRLAAGYVTLLRRALIADVVQLEDLVLEEFGGAGSPEAKAFLVMLGPLAVRTESLLAWTDNPDNIERLVRSLFSSKRVVDVEQEYADYERLRKEFLDRHYRPYEKASKDYIERGERLAQRAEAAWLDVQQNLDQGWEAYQTAQSGFIDGYVQLMRRQQTLDRYMEFVERRVRCKERARCSRLEREYESMIRQIIDPPPDWRYFCYKAPPPGSNVGLEAIGRLLQGGSFLGMVNDLNRIATEGKCSPNEATFARLLAHHDRGKFPAAPGNRAGLPMGLDRDEYLHHPKLAKHVRGELRSRYGVALGEGWLVMDQQAQEAFYAAFLEAGEAEALRQLRKALRAAGDEAIKEGLDVREFERLPVVQAKLKATVGERYFPGYSLMLSERQYDERIVRPRLEVNIRNELALFREGSAHYGNGGKFEEQGKDQLRLVLMPPSAVALSLLFSLMSLARISSSLLAPALVKFLDLKEGWRTWIATFLVWVVPMGTVIALPFLVTNNYAESKAWDLLSREAAAQSPATALMSEYVMRVQPIFAVVGYPMLRAFDPYGLAPPRADAVSQVSGRSHTMPRLYRGHH